MAEVMNAGAVKALVVAHLSDCEVSVEGEGANYSITVVGARFAGMRPVQRQQMVYAALNAEIASGAIHAVNIRALTPEQAAL